MFRKTGLVLLFGLFALIISGCGSYTTGNHSMLFKSGVGNTNGTGDNLPAPTSTLTPGPNIVVTPTPTATKGVPAIQFRVGAVGYTSASINIYTGRVLKIKFTAGVADTTVAGTGYTAQYSGIGVYIGVGSTSRPTPLLYNGLLGGAAQSSSVMDFATSISANCAPADVTCRKDVTVNVSQPNNDYWCFNFAMYCPWTRVHDTHPWNGTLSIQTDDTDPIE
jgi:hypothetical protein